MEGHPEGARPTVRCVCLRSGEESVWLGGSREGLAIGGRSAASSGPSAGQPRSERPCPGGERAGATAPRHPLPVLSAPKSLPQHFQGTSSAPLRPLPAYLLPEPLFSSGRFLSSTQAEGFSLASLAQLSPGASAEGPLPHGWPKMENAQRRKMEARRLRVACSVASSPPGAS